MLRGDADHNSIFDKPHVDTLTEAIKKELEGAPTGDDDWKALIETKVLPNLTSKQE